MKKFISLFLVLFMLLPMSTSVFAQGTVHLYVDKKYVNEAHPFIENDRTMVPVRALAERMGAEVFWVEAERKVVLNKPCDKMEYNGVTYENAVAVCELVLDKNDIRIKLLKDGNEIFNVLKTLDCAAKSYDGYTHIPARFVGYALGYSVDYKRRFENHLIYYDFIGKQTIDFDDYSGDTKRIDYEYDKEKYPDVTVINGAEYPSRNGYADTVIIDTEGGRFEDGVFIKLPPYKGMARNYILESPEKKYEISNNNAPEQNLENFANFYADKVGEQLIIQDNSDGGKSYNLEYMLNKTTWLGYRKGESIGVFDEFRYLDDDTKYYSISPASSLRYDYSKMTYKCLNKFYDYYGTLLVGDKEDSLLQDGLHKNGLMALNAFLGETGQRIHKMIDDYNTLSGAFDVPYGTEWTKTMYDVDGELTNAYFDPISKEAVEYYGLEYVTTYTDNIGYYTLVLQTPEQKIYVAYSKPLIEKWMGKYCTVVFEKIEN